MLRIMSKPEGGPQSKCEKSSHVCVCQKERGNARGKKMRPKARQMCENMKRRERNR